VPQGYLNFFQAGGACREDESRFFKLAARAASMNHIFLSWRRVPQGC
jgi:hypothetical protein